MLTKILVPVDGSENSLRALDQAIFIAKTTGAQITAIHVIERPPTVYVESQKLLDDLLSNYRKESTKILDGCKEMARKSGIALETVIAEGDPASSIAGYSEQGGFDLVVLGSRGLGKLKEMMVGSTSSKVLHQAMCSVMVVK